MSRLKTNKRTWAMGFILAACLAGVQAWSAEPSAREKDQKAKGAPRSVAVPEKTVVLTFDDSVASHARYVGPYLKKLGFGGTFFITEGFKFTTDKKHYMTWQEIKTLHGLGFEIGNHTRRHIPVRNQPLDQLKLDVLHIEKQCKAFGIPKPVSFCYPAYQTSSKAVGLLRELGYRFGRAGGARAADPQKDDPLLLPQVFDAKPKSTFEQFVAAVGKARGGQAAIVTFHGVPDIKHPWVSTDQKKFEKYMGHLKANKFKVVALRDLAPYFTHASKKIDAEEQSPKP